MGKTIFAFLFFACTSLPCYCQVSRYSQTTEAIQTPEPSTSIAVTYRLFPTQNLWTFLKLNTRTGQMWQVQFDVKGDNRMETILSSMPLVLIENETNERFTLYSTQNIYTFILLDQLNGKVSQVQWSMEEANRGIIPIE